MSDERHEQRGRSERRGNPVPPAQADRAEALAKTEIQTKPEIQAKKVGQSRAGSEAFATYDDAMAFLMDRVNVERAKPGKVDPHAFKFDRTVALMKALGDPHTQFKCVHVAGSKGKGSVCEMAAASLQGCGLTTGLYTSPHLVDPRERIRINGRMIPKEDFREVAGRVAQAVPKVRKAHGDPTFFELFTAAAFLHFAEQAVDIAVIEVGLGGRLDCTNVVTPEVCAITSIQLEHTQILGDTLEQIAFEKAGIIKRGVPVVTYAQQSESILEVFRKVSEERQAPLRVLGKDVEFSCRFESSPELGPHARVVLSSPRATFEHLPVPLKGEHQAMNCGLVLAILDALKERGFSMIDEKGVAEGLARTPNPGRMELVHDEPRIFVDGAHNPESIAALMKSIGAYVRYDSMVVVFGCAADKDVAGMLAKLASGADKVIFTKAAKNPRAVDPRELLRRFTELDGNMAQVAPTVKDALNLAARAVTREDIIVVTGSFYIAGEAKRLLEEKKGKK